MTRYVVILYLSMLLCFEGEAQKNVNFIISIDEKINVQITRLRLVALIDENIKETYLVSYVPGNLSLSDSDYERLLDPRISKIYLAFDYNDESSKGGNINYEIDFKKGWLNHHYFILYIYNLSKKKYRRMFRSSDSKFVYEFDFPGGSTRLVRSQ